MPTRGTPIIRSGCGSSTPRLALRAGRDTRARRSWTSSARRGCRPAPSTAGSARSTISRAAVLERTVQVALFGDPGITRVADLLARMGRVKTGPLSDDEAVRLEAFVVARSASREVAQAINEAIACGRAIAQPLLDAAVADGTLVLDVDPEAVLFYMRSVGLGLLLQRVQPVCLHPTPTHGSGSRPIAREHRRGQSRIRERGIFTMTATELPDSSEVDASIKLVTDNAQRVFCWNYERDRDQLVTLYKKGDDVAVELGAPTSTGRSTSIPKSWSRTSPQPNVIVTLARAAAEVAGSPIANVGRGASSLQLGVEIVQGAAVSQFMHGEQGAMIVAAKIVETVPWIDAKYYAATQTMDEARHTEVFAQVPPHQAR